MFEVHLQILKDIFEGKIGEEILKFAIEEEIRINNNADFKSFVAESTMIALPGLELCIGEDVDIEIVVKALCENKKIANIEFLRLNDNEAEKLGRALRTNNTLTTLNLGSTQVSDPGATAIGNALQTNSTLTTLNLRGTRVSDRGATAIANALQTNNTLTTLYLECTQVSYGLQNQINKTLQQ